MRCLVAAALFSCQAWAPCAGATAPLAGLMKARCAARRVASKRACAAGDSAITRLPLVESAAFVVALPCPRSIAKKSYGRGAGTPMTCAAGLVNDAALCYPACPNTAWYATLFRCHRGGVPCLRDTDGCCAMCVYRDGVGPVCWENCPAAQGLPSDYGAICCSNGVCPACA